MNQQESVKFAQKYLGDLLSFFELNVEVRAEYDGEILELTIPSTEANSILIGRNAETLRSLQYLVSTTLRNRDAAITRVNIDVADYKKQRADKLAKQAREWFAEVLRSGDTKFVDLNAADRRVVHQVATEYPEIYTFSEGEGRDRRLVITQRSS